MQGDGDRGEQRDEQQQGADDERLRVDAGSPVQSVVFPAAGFGRDFYYCSFAALTRVSA